MILVTQLPFYRIHEIDLYFLKNVEILKPEESIVLIDNVYHEKQKEILKRILPADVSVRYGNWRNRHETWLDIFSEFNGSTLVAVDSDNVVEPHLREIIGILNEPVVGIVDLETWNNEKSRNELLRRSRKYYEVNGLPIYRFPVISKKKGDAFFFFGPKQAVVFKKFPDIEILEKLRRALKNVNSWLINIITDETTLAVICYLMGIKETVWTIASHHYHHGSMKRDAKKDRFLIATAHAQLAKGLVREFGLKEFKTYYMRYRLAQIRNIRLAF
jgi:hypothetical protein